MDQKVQIIIEALSEGKGLDDVVSGLAGVSKGAGLATAAIGATVAAVGLLVVGLEELSRISLKAFAEAEFSSKSLEFALKGTNASLQEMLDLSTELQSKSLFSDEQIQAGITFLGLQGRTEEQIRKTTMAAVDFAAANGVDLQQAFKTLDATIEGNIGKLGKLDGQIKDLTPTQLANGKAIEILAEKYKGFAENQATTTLIGQWEVIKNTFGDVLEIIGSLVAQGVQPLLDLMKALIPIVSSAVTSFVEFAKGLFDADSGAVAFGKSIGGLVIKAVQFLADLIEQKLYPAFENLTDTVNEYYEKHGPALVKIYETIGKTIITTVVVALNLFIKGLEILVDISSGVVSALEWIGGAVQSVSNWFASVVPTTWVDSIRGVVEDAKKIFIDLYNWAQDQWWMKILIPGLAFGEKIGVDKGVGPERKGDGDNNVPKPPPKQNTPKPKFSGKEKEDKADEEAIKKLKEEIEKIEFETNKRIKEGRLETLEKNKLLLEQNDKVKALYDNLLPILTKDESRVAIQKEINSLLLENLDLENEITDEKIKQLEIRMQAEKRISDERRKSALIDRDIDDKRNETRIKHIENEYQREQELIEFNYQQELKNIKRTADLTKEQREKLSEIAQKDRDEQIEELGKSVQEALYTAVTNSLSQAFGIVNQIADLLGISFNDNSLIVKLQQAFGIVQSIVSLIKTLDTISSIFDFFGGIGGAVASVFGGASGGGHAEGGLISGPGNGTSDSIPTRLSNGEFVVNAMSTALNLPLLQQINNGVMFSNTKRIAMGGLYKGSSQTPNVYIKANVPFIEFMKEAVPDYEEWKKSIKL